MELTKTEYAELTTDPSDKLGIILAAVMGVAIDGGMTPKTRMAILEDFGTCSDKVDIRRKIIALMSIRDVLKSLNLDDLATRGR